LEIPGDMLFSEPTFIEMLEIPRYNKRYFTLDFDTHTFFYAHSEGSKKVWLPDFQKRYHTTAPGCHWLIIILAYVVQLL